VTIQYTTDNVPDSDLRSGVFVEQSIGEVPNQLLKILWQSSDKLFVRVKIRISLSRRRCVVCGRRVACPRRRTGRMLCCDVHEQQILADLRVLARTRLEGAAREFYNRVVGIDPAKARPATLATEPEQGA
jgi:hypothetical protein